MPTHKPSSQVALRFGPLVGIPLLVLWLWHLTSGTGLAADLAAGVALAREFLACETAEERDEMADALEEYDDQIDDILQELGAAEYESVEPGYHPAEHFSVAELRDRYPDDLLYFSVPESYDPEEPTGLVVFLHGGGNTSSRRAPRYFLNFPGEDEGESSSQLGDLFDAAGLIAVGPSALWDEESSYRWCLPKADDYLAAVIEECKARFRIDAERVYLIGHSMGGFGAYHHIQRQPDRFAAVVVNAGSWSLGYWPAIRGTPLYIIQGVNDAQKGYRWHYTDIEYARWSDKLLSKYELDHVYWEHDGEHGVADGRPYLEKFLSSAAEIRRDPYAPHVALGSPAGFKRWYCFPVEHNRWLTLNETVRGTIRYDELLDNDDENEEDDFDLWRLEHRTSRREGASLDAVDRGDNTVLVKTRNVSRFTVWLHPQMIDVDEPVTIIVDGDERFDGSVHPSLATALESYLRRRDWGLVYPIKIELETNP
ncbi:MAG: alpha/beta fold hydrolase [Planctomycetales bacterium]